MDLTDEERLAALAQMYPENQPLPGVEGDVGGDMMVSLPGQQLGNELRVAPGESEVMSVSPPFAGPPPPRQPLQAQPMEPSSMPVQPPAPMPQRAPAEKPWDWQRAFTAFGGGDVGALDRKRQYEAEAPLRAQQMALQQADLQDRMEERRGRSQELRDSLDPSSELSKSAAEDYARVNQARAQLLAERNPKLSAMFAAEAERATGKNRVQIAQMAKTSREILGDFGMMLDREGRERLAKMREDDVTADNARADKALNMRGARGRGPGGTSKEDAKRIQMQLKSIDKKAIEELQNMGTMDSMFNEAEKELPNAYTGPAAGVLVKGNDALKAIGLGGIVPDKLASSLNSTQKLGADFEQAIADLRKGRFGSSLTSGEQAAIREWAPNKQLSEEGNRNLMSAARKYMSLRIQERLGQVLQEVGTPFYLPPDTVLDLGDAKRIKSLFTSMNFYDQSQTADTINTLNEILGKYGGRIAGAPSRSVAAQVGKGAPSPASAPPPSGEKPPQQPGSQPGQKMRSKKTGTVWTWDGSKWGK